MNMQSCLHILFKQEVSSMCEAISQSSSPCNIVGAWFRRTRKVATVNFSFLSSCYCLFCSCLGCNRASLFCLPCQLWDEQKVRRTKHKNQDSKVVSDECAKLVVPWECLMVAVRRITSPLLFQFNV